jgi:hypothetical protein
MNAVSVPYVLNLQYIAEKQAAVARNLLLEYLDEVSRFQNGPLFTDRQAFQNAVASFWSRGRDAAAEQEKSFIASLRARVWLCGMTGA